MELKKDQTYFIEYTLLSDKFSNFY